jgi:hypothetical protein
MMIWRLLASVLVGADDGHASVEHAMAGSRQASMARP